MSLFDKERSARYDSYRRESYAKLEAQAEKNRRRDMALRTMQHAKDETTKAIAQNIYFQNM